MSKTDSIILTLVLVIIIGIIFFGGLKPKNNIDTTSDKIVQNSEMKDGIQYITINAKGGYSPQISQARASIPTKLIVETDGTYDCSASLAINSIGYREILPQTGTTEIDLGIPKSGEPLQGVCGMGMYNFQIQFN